MLPLGAAKCGAGFDSGGLPVKSKLEWLVEEPGMELIIGWRGLDPQEMKRRGWVQIGWTKRGKLPVWMPRQRGLFDGQHRPEGGSGP